MKVKKLTDDDLFPIIHKLLINTFENYIFKGDVQLNRTIALTILDEYPQFKDYLTKLTDEDVVALCRKLIRSFANTNSEESKELYESVSQYRICIDIWLHMMNTVFGLHKAASILIEAILREQQAY